jgi:hypothetical protein
MSSPTTPAPLTLALDPEALRPLVRDIVAEVLTQVRQEEARLDGRLAYSEEEAARLLGLLPHVLRDERLRGRIAASAIVGRRVRYLRADLLAYLMGRRSGPADGGKEKDQSRGSARRGRP